MADENVTASENTTETTEQADDARNPGQQTGRPEPSVHEAACSEPRGLRQEGSAARRSGCSLHRILRSRCQGRRSVRPCRR